jgi:hypothetical protein
MLLFVNLVVIGQVLPSSLRVKKIEIISDSTLLDSLSIVPGSMVVMSNNQFVSDSSYLLLPVQSILVWLSPVKGEVIITYRVFPLNFNKTYFHKDTNSIFHHGGNSPVPFRFPTVNRQSEIFNMGGINKSGSISRGVMFGNNQDLSINSNLNLQLSGKISSNISILASVTDDNLPIQPEGNTQQLQDFDQVFIQLFSDTWRLTAGDFWMKKPDGYFLNYNKRAQGGSFTKVSNNVLKKHKNADTIMSFVENRFSAAISKGKFARNVIQGVEGNQGPYRLSGAENEQFVIVLSGTEMVYIDGMLLTRGQENDYVIDYNTSEIEFTPKQLITKDKRITIEFQYSDKNYARSVVESSNLFNVNDWKVHLNVYSEQDSKNQPLQQDLLQSEKDLLAQVGDDLLAAIAPSADSIGFSADQVLYKKVDSLGYTPVYVNSNNPDSAYYRLIFSNVGMGNGNYIDVGFSAFGRLYKWIAPDTLAGVLILKGTYEPVRVLATPKKRQMITAGFEKKISKHSRMFFDAAISNEDLNTFSQLSANDNSGYAIKASFNTLKPIFSSKNWKFKSAIDFETQSSNFKRIERFRTVEFQRNWNVQSIDNLNDQYNGVVSLGLLNRDAGLIQYDFTTYQITDTYSGYRNMLKVDWKKFVNAKINASYLSTKGVNQTSFLRHKSDISKQFGVLRIGFKDDHEMNLFKTGDSLWNNSYQYYDWEVYVQNQDSSKNKFRFFYKERLDKYTSNNRINNAALAMNPGVSIELSKNPNHRFGVRSMYRVLEIKDTVLTAIKPDNTLLNRVEYNMTLLNGAIRTSTFYEIGNGLELKKVFAYIEVPSGQGVYTWVDYNDDNIKDLSEFEIAAFSDQATYIRVFTPSNEYVKIFSNQLNQVVSLTPRFVIKSKKGVGKFIKRFNTQTALRIERKTSLQDLLELTNPFITNVSDTALQSLSSSFRNSAFFNRSNPKFGLEYTYQEVKNKLLLVSGFDSRERALHQEKIRWNITRKITFQTSTEQEVKINKSDYAPNKNYKLINTSAEVRLTVQPSTVFRTSFSGSYREKQNMIEFGGQKAYITDIGWDLKFNQLKKGVINTTVNYIMIDYVGESNTSVAFEMLEALQPGNNITWNFSYQRTLANNLQLTINYLGRKIEENNAIHTGGVQVRAFF